MEPFWYVVGKIADAEGAWRLLRWTAPLARRLRHRHRDAIIMSGFAFFPDRPTLAKTRDYDEELARAENIDAAYITGRLLAEQDVQNIRHIRRLILPDPRSESLVSYAISVQNSPELQRYIIRTTRTCQEDHGIEVRWYPHMYHMSFMVGDKDQNHGWLHLEITAPFSRPNRRPSFSVSKSRHEAIVRDFARLFEDMWNASHPPDEGYLQEQESKPIIEM